MRATISRSARHNQIMKYSTKTGSLSATRFGCLVASLKTARKTAAGIGAGKIFTAAATDFSDHLGQTLIVRLGSGSPLARIVVVGGLDKSVSAADFSKAVKVAGSALKFIPGKNALWTLTKTPVAKRDPYWKASTALSVLSNTFYSFNQHKTASTEVTAPTINTIGIHADERTKASVVRAVRHAQALKTGLDWARDLGNEPPNVCTPSYLLREARKLAKDPKVSVSVLDEKRMAELNMGAFLAVSKGSETPGKMIIVRYQGARRRADAPIALVGKGITFDTGGISLKSPGSMDEMKFDMCGAACVLGATRAAIAAHLPINIVTVVAAAENMPSGRATRPGDIVKSSSGRTIEIINTDAEGRLVLCDALTYVARYKPKAVVDVATLTGACIVALGSHASAVYANDDELARSLVAAGEFSGDRAWQMPLWDEYQPALKSPFADIVNSTSGGAGSIMAACFLSRFTEDLSWAHMDVAGSAFSGGANKGSTGRPVGLLYRYLIEEAGQ